jgi:hypothetical protein
MRKDFAILPPKDRQLKISPAIAADKMDVSSGDSKKVSETNGDVTI